MKIENLPLEGLKLIHLDLLEDNRGFFFELYNEKTFKEHGLSINFVQDNRSRSVPGVVRGLHFQLNPPQSKLICVIRGKILDVVVDIRPKSKTFGQHYKMELSDTEGKLIWVPAGFAHGFCVLGDEAAGLFYKEDAHYSPSTERGIYWNDPDLNIPWPVENPILSERDQGLQSFANYIKNHA